MVVFVDDVLEVVAADVKPVNVADMARPVAAVSLSPGRVRDTVELDSGTFTRASLTGLV